jgi:hypothetical protein
MCISRIAIRRCHPEKFACQTCLSLTFRAVPRAHFESINGNGHDGFLKVVFGASYGLAQAVTDLIEQGAPAFEAATPILAQLLKAELAEREVRSIAYHMKSARFPAYKDLSGFDFAASEINEATVRTLHRCEFMDGAQNVVLIGGLGTGKTHVATALGIQACLTSAPMGQFRHIAERRVSGSS